MAAAIAARQRGLDVTVADSAVPPIDKACGEGLMPDALAAARSLGIELENVGWPFRGIRFCDAARPGTVTQSDFPGGSGFGLRRTTLHTIMVKRAAEAGVNLAWGTHIAGINTDGRSGEVLAGGQSIRSRWIVGADGGHSRVRGWAGLECCERDTRRFGFRRHYQVAPWSEFMEIHWGDRCQLYITPVDASEVCVVLISADAYLRLDDALPRFPELAARLQGTAFRPERGGVSASRRLKRVYRENVALIGDASGSVDAITGEGICLLFQQAVSLADALATGDLASYQREHRRLGRRPQMMADLMLLMDQRERLRHRTLRVLSEHPQIFSGMLKMHVGKLPKLDFFTNTLSLGWRLLTL